MITICIKTLLISIIVMFFGGLFFHACEKTRNKESGDFWAVIFGLALMFFIISLIGIIIYY